MEKLTPMPWMVSLPANHQPVDWMKQARELQRDFDVSKQAEQEQVAKATEAKSK